MATRFTRTLTKTALSNAKLSLRVMCMTSFRTIRSCWAMKSPLVPMRLTAQMRPATSWNVLVLQIRCIARVALWLAGHYTPNKFNKPLSTEDKRRNDVIAVIRSGSERPFATQKSRNGLARTRFMELAKNKPPTALQPSLITGANGPIS